MRALTLWQPMAWAIAEGHKLVENRVWPLPARFIAQRFAVHAGMRYDEPWATEIRERFMLPVPRRSEIALGAVVAVGTFVACIDDNDVDDLLESSPAIRDWYSGPFGFVLGDVRKLATPVPCRGFQGLWTLPADIEAAVLAQQDLSLPPMPSLFTPPSRPQLSMFEDAPRMVCAFDPPDDDDPPFGTGI